MATWSVPIRQGWRLRVLSGTSLGREFDLPGTRYVLGSQPPSDIVIPAAGIAPRHMSIAVCPDHIEIADCSGGFGIQVNGKRVASARLFPGDRVTVGSFSFEFANSGLVRSPSIAGRHALLGRWDGLPLPYRVGIITVTVAVVLFLLLVVTHAPSLVPITLISMSAAVPVPLICYLVEKYDKTGISFYTLAVTFLAGGTIGIISAMIGFIIGGTVSGGLLFIPIFAGVLEEPAKLLATCWRWRHPGYDRPMDGLIIGTVSGFGFAVFESAGYGFSALAGGGGLEGLLGIMVVRAALSPFGHGLWSGILAAAFWQCGRDPRRAIRSRLFQTALAWAVGLHALWNVSAVVIHIGLGFTILSAILSVRQYRQLLAKMGYR